MNKPVLLLLTAFLAFALPASARAETFLLYIEELKDGEAAPPPLPSLEGVMAGMFDLGHIFFDTGAYVPEFVWETRQFRELLGIARAGGAHFLAAAQVLSQVLPPAQGGGSDGSARGFAEVRARARYYLLNVETSALMGQGELALDNCGREQELTYEALLFQVGEMTARQISRLWEAGRS